MAKSDNEETTASKSLGTVKMFGTGNFVIGETLYAFRDGEEIEVVNETHRPSLEAEAKRREKVLIKTNAITEAMRDA